MAEQEKKNNTQMDRVVDPAKTIRGLLERSKQQVMAALPGGVKPDQFLRVAVTTIQRGSHQLQQANPMSLLGAIMEAAQSGLSLDRAKREADLVPFWSKKNNCYEVQFMPRFGGYIKMAHDSGKVSSIFARVVYEKEVFSIEYGATTVLHHKPLPPSDRGEGRKGAYAIANMKDGAVQTEFMWEDEIMEIRARSRAKDDGPWVTDPDEMRKKTVIRRLAKVLPLSPEWTKVGTRDEYREVGVEFPSDFEIDASPEAALAGEGYVAPEEKKSPQGGTEGAISPGTGKVEASGSPPREPGEDAGVPEKAVLPPGGASKIIMSGSKAKQNQELGSISTGQVGMIGARLSELGYKSDGERHWALAQLLGVEVKSAKSLSSAEGSAVIDVLKAVQAERKE